MGVYHQMGHQSTNLLGEAKLKSYIGAIFSPVNDDFDTLYNLAQKFKDKENFETIFDPQLYYPRTPREKLRTWNYFPNDYSTVDFSTVAGWRGVLQNLRQTITKLKPDAVCSPITVPKIYSDEYFDLTNNVAKTLQDEISNLNIDVLQTVLIDYTTLSSYDRVMAISSIVTRSSVKRLYLIFVGGNQQPRRENDDTESLKGAMLLINHLAKNGFQVLVGFCSSDIILWKTSGATSCATGKFWNLRRFNPGRWGDPSEDGGGGQVPYFVEEALCGFLRESDIARTESIRSEISLNNPYYEEIKNKIQIGQPWLALSWRQYLYWFSDIEMRLQTKQITSIDLLRDADENWEWVDDSNIFMEERRNDGRWIRPWLRSIVEYSDPW